MWLDCDVIQADGGTRTASITGAYVALALAMERMVAAGILKAIPLTDSVAATSVGMLDGEALLDLAYEEDSRAEVDMNVVMTGSGKFVEVQATAEGEPFARRATPGSAGAGGNGNPPGYGESIHTGAKPISVSAQSKPLRLFVASSNQGKLREYRALASAANASIELDLIPNFEAMLALRRDRVHIRRKCRGKSPALQPIFPRHGACG